MTLKCNDNNLSQQPINISAYLFIISSVSAIIILLIPSLLLFDRDAGDAGDAWENKGQNAALIQTRRSVQSWPQTAHYAMK